MQSSNYIFREIDLKSEADLESLEDQQGTGHPDVFIPGFVATYNNEVDDADTGLREYIEGLLKHPEAISENCNGSEFYTNLAKDYSNIKDLDAVGDFFWGDQCEFSKRVRMKGKYVWYTYIPNPECEGVCFMVRPETIQIEEIPEGEYITVSRSTF